MVYNENLVDEKIDELRISLFEIVEGLSEDDYNAFLDLALSEIEGMPEYADL